MANPTPRPSAGPAAPTAAEPIVDVRNVCKSFGDVQVLRDVSLKVFPREVVVIAGRSGSGKSTLLRCIDRLETIDSGRIYACGHLIGFREVDGRLVALRERDIAAQRRDLGMVFQQFNLFPHMSVLANIVAAPINVLGVDRKLAEADARALLATVGLPEKADSYPKHLSGGQQQRVAIARALAMKPKLMLFDEPTSALDPEMISEVLEVMETLSKRGMTMIVITHEMGFARAVANRVVLMNGGVIVEDSPPDRFFTNPKSDLARQFLAKTLRH